MATNRLCLDCKCDISSLRKDALRCKCCSKRLRNKRYYEKKRVYLSYKKSLGTGELKEHRNEDFDKEYRLIQKEKKKLRLIK